MTKSYAREALLGYRLSDLDPALTQTIARDSPLWTRWFFIAEQGSELTAALFAALPEPPMPAEQVERGMRLARDIAALVTPSKVFQQHFAKLYNGLKVGFHTGDATAVEAWLASQKVTPHAIGPVFDGVVMFRLRTPDGVFVNTAMMRSLVVNAYLRNTLKPACHDVFALDPTDNSNERFVLYHAELPFTFLGTKQGPGERCAEFGISDLRAGAVTTLTLGDAVPVGISLRDARPETVAVATLSELDPRLCEGIPEDSPLRSRLFWVAPTASRALDALWLSAPEPAFGHTSAALRVMHRIEARLASLDTTALWPRGTALEAGFRSADGAEARAWLASHADAVRCVSLGELLGR